MNSSALVKSQNEKDILLALLFSTKEPNGLLVWYGQNKAEAYSGQDFIALAIVDGFLEFSLRLDGEETTVRNVNTRVDDGVRHIAVLTRNGNRATLELDNFSVYGETTETSRNFSYLPGNIFIGEYSSALFCFKLVWSLQGKLKIFFILFLKNRWCT